MKVKIPVISLLRDNGDGGYSIFVYNSKKELLADHCYLDPDLNLSKDEYNKRCREILSGDDEYEHGYIDTSTIEVEIDENNNVKLAKSIYFHAGQ